jgi:hypothetical protein
MNTRHFPRWSWPVLFTLVVVLPFFALTGATQTGAQNNSSVKTTNGLTVVTFAVDPGKIIVSLPDDLRAGDTISGTVVEEPKGTTAAEKEKNKSVLEGMVIDLEGTKVRASKPSLIWTPPIPSSTSQPPYSLKIVPVYSNGSAAGESVRVPITGRPLRHVGERGVLTTGNPYSPEPAGSKPPSGEVIKIDPKMIEPVSIPPLGQTGRPIVITGPFDGSFDNTKLTIGGQPMKPLAESPRKLVVESPTNVTGPVGISVNEGGKETKGTFRNLRVDLTAPKTSLLKGESTELHVEVQGLQGIKEPIPLHLTNGGAVTMQGGNTQTMSIKPAEVQSNGIYTTTRTITGVQAGVWNATATVVVFDFCLQDDANGDLLTFSSTTGDYIFCQGRSALAGPNPIALSTLNFLGTDFSSGVRVSAGDVNDSGRSATIPVSIGPGASITRNGAITVADFNYKPGYIHIQIDDYSHTGSASGYVYQPPTVPSNAGPKKINFTITDRDTRNNTCACK